MNLYTHGIIRSSSNPAYDADAAAFFTATGITDVGQKSAVNQLVLDLKSNSLWTKFIAIYPFVGGSATSHKYNLKDPQDLDASYRLTFSGGITHDANGVTGNGVNGYYRTFITPSSHLSQDNTSVFVYLRTNSSGAYIDIGSIKTGAPQHRIQINPRNGTNFFTSACNDTTVSSVANSDSRGLIGLSRTASGSYVQSINSTQTTVSVTSTALNSVEIYGLAVNSGGPANYSARNQAFACIGTGLTNSECDTLYTLVQTFQTSLGRQV